ncbi:hypothetical protein [Streptomyces mirabilis]
MSVLGLLTSAVATLWQVRVSNDQLQQSKEAAEQKMKRSGIGGGSMR